MLVASAAEISRTQAATLIATGCVAVGGRREKASYRPKPGEHIAVAVPVGRERTVVPESIPLRIVYEDTALLVVDKPAGMVVHPAPGHWSGTLVNALLGRQDEAAITDPIDPIEPPRIRSRAPASFIGWTRIPRACLLVAKTEQAHRRLSAAMAERQIRRRYAVLVWGHLREDRLTIEQPIGRDPRDRKRMAIVSTGRPARTDFVRLARFDSVDLFRAGYSRAGRTRSVYTWRRRGTRSWVTRPTVGAGDAAL